MKPIIEICLGSSCFSRGNALTLERIEEILNRLTIRDEIELNGRLCAGMCAEGPCLTIAGTSHHRITPDKAEELILASLPDWTAARA